VGIREEDLGKLFKPFVQLDGSLSRQYSGTGLGLSLVRRMAELHGGGVHVESVYGEGSRFTIILPWRETDTLEVKSAAETASAPSAKAFVVEDNPLDAEILTRHLKELGVAAVVYPVLEGALEKAVALKPGEILLDLNLPDGSGLDLLVRLKADERTMNIPVTIVSVEDQRLKAMAMGAQGYLVKPYTREELRETLEKTMGLQGEGDKVLVVEEKGDKPFILIADDSEVILDTVTGFLESRGYKTIAVRNGIELLHTVEEVKPDLMLVDIQMPGMDGIEAIGRIRAMGDQALATVPIIVITALAMGGDREKCIMAGANEYLSKPFTLAKLEAMICGLLKRG
jgi:CheY-like chemotaxis protein